MITNPEAIRFTNEQVRTSAEDITAMVLRGAILMDEWAQTTGDPANPTIGDFFMNDTTGLVDDGRELEGVSRLTGGEVTTAMGFIGMLLTMINDPANAAAVAAIKKATVRQIRVA